MNPNDTAGQTTTRPQDSQPLAPPQRATFPAIDILRGFAALMVLMYHVLIFGKWEGVDLGGAWVVWARGWSGVDLFLVISGFVISWTALNSHAARGTAFRKDFALRRFWRIAPLYFLTCLVYLVLVNPHLLVLPLKVIAPHVVSHLFFVHNLYSETHGSINGTSWSVGLEMQFYLVILLATPWIARVHAARTLLAVALFALAYRYVTTLIWPPHQTPPIVQFIYASQLPGVIDQFACGILLALTLHRKQGFLLRHLQVGWKNFAAWTLLALPPLFLAIYLDQAYKYWNEVGMIIGWRPLATVGFTALLAAALVFPWASSRLLAPLRYLGQVSYGIYLWHMPVIAALNTNLPHLTKYHFMWYVMAGTLMLASFSWHWFEKPCIERKGLK